MYTLFNTKAIWSVSLEPGAPICYNALSATPVMINAPPSVSRPSVQPVYYQVQPTWTSTMESSNNTIRPRLSSDDVFLPEGTLLYEVPVCAPVVPTLISQPYNQPGARLCSQKAEIKNKPNSLARKGNTNSQSSNKMHFPVHSKDDGRCNTWTTVVKDQTRFQPFANSFDSLSLSGNSNTSSSPKSQTQDDSLIQELLHSSVERSTPLKTSSPIQEQGNDARYLIDINKLRKRRGQYITSSSSEKCPRFSENGTDADLNQCDKILLNSRGRNHEEEQAKQEEEFQLILEAERERQKKIVLRKHSPKMLCKFCKNNGEIAEVYTKHKLHSNEKTVCPLLRHYVCPLCNSTGDFAHTIRYCPFNDRRDTLAWKATFLI